MYAFRKRHKAVQNFFGRKGKNKSEKMCLKFCSEAGVPSSSQAVGGGEG